MSKKTDISCHKSSNVMLSFGILWQVWEPLYRTFGNVSPNGRAEFLLRTDLHQPIWELSVVLTPAAIWNSSGRKAVAIHHIDLAAGGSKNVQMYTKIIKQEKNFKKD